MLFEPCKPPANLFNVGTIGHLDHGKTTLTSALKKICSQTTPLGPDDSAFDAFLHRGIQLVASPIEYRSAARHYLHADLPGDTSYARHLVVSAAKMDCAILVCSAVKGVMHQTHEHVLLARQAGVKGIVVFISMVDLADHPDAIGQVEQEVRALLTGYGYPGSEVAVIAGSAQMALEGCDNNGLGTSAIMALLAALDAVQISNVTAAHKPFLMAVEDVFKIDGRGLVVAGRVEQGVLSVGDTVDVVGINPLIQANVLGIERYRQRSSESQAVAGDHTSVLLGGLAGNDVQRGQVLSAPGHLIAHSTFRAQVYLLSHVEGGRIPPFFNEDRAQFFFRGVDIAGHFKMIEQEMLSPGEHMTLIVEMARTVAMSQGLRFAIREEGRTVGWGVVTEPLS